MHLKKFAATVVVCLLFASVLTLASETRTNPTANTLAQYGSLPLSFEPNVGQLHSPEASAVKFLTRGKGYAAFLTNREAIIRIGTKPALIRMQLVGANTGTMATGETPLPGKVNYLFGHDPQQWHTDIPTFGSVKFREVYEGIDLVYYGNQRKLEHDFVLAPHARVSDIRMRVAGGDKLRIAQNGDLVVSVANGELRWRKPVVYQKAGGKKKRVEGEYALKGDEVAFNIGAYDRGRPLVIDPALVYSTYLGGSKGIDDNPSGGQEEAAGIAVDSAGNAYIVGTTDAIDFPTTSGAYKTAPNFPSGCDPNGPCTRSIFVTKLNSNGTTQIYSTYTDETQGSAQGIAIDSGGRAYIIYEDFLTPGPANGEFLILNAAGSAVVFRMTFQEGTVVRAIAVDSNGIAYLTGATFPGGIPVTANAYQISPGSAEFDLDAFLMKVDPSKSGTASVLYSSYLGGTGDELGFGITQSFGKTYVTGKNGSADFPTTAGAFQRTLRGPHDAFVAKFDTNLSGTASLLYSTLLGGDDEEMGLSVAANSSGNAFVYGSTLSTNFPTTAGAFQRTAGGTGCAFPPCTDAFVTKLNASGSGLVYSTLLRGSGNDAPSPLINCCFLGPHIALDSFANAYVVGETTSTNFPTTANALRRTRSGDLDGFFVKLNSTGSGLNFGTYLGGSSTDRANAIALRGTTYIVGDTFSTNFPTVSTAFQQSRRGPSDAFVMKFSFPACTVSTTNRTVTICTPGSNSTVKSPVHVIAQTTDSQQVTSLHVAVDGVKKFQANANSLDTSISMSAGVHRITVVAKDATGYYWKTINITVQ